MVYCAITVHRLSFRHRLWVTWNEIEKVRENNRVHFHLSPFEQKVQCLYLHWMQKSRETGSENSFHTHIEPLGCLRLALFRIFSVLRVCIFHMRRSVCAHKHEFGKSATIHLLVHINECKLHIYICDWRHCCRFRCRRRCCHKIYYRVNYRLCVWVIYTLPRYLVFSRYRNVRTLYPCSSLLCVVPRSPVIEPHLSRSYMPLRVCSIQWHN